MIRWRLGAHLLLGLVAGSCLPPDESRSADDRSLLNPPLDGRGAIVDVRVWNDPYADVDWATTLRLKAQTHDHTGLVAARLLSYDSAGYDFVPIMEYSGVASLDYSARRRLWPSDAVLPISVKEGVRHVRAWLPNMEEVGFAHVTSPLLTNYIAKWESSEYATRESWMYSSTQEAIDLIAANGGFPILAHPWGHWSQFADLHRYRGVEIYSAYAEHKFAAGPEPYFRERNRNEEIVGAWDRALMRGELIVGVAVNDHFGPYRPLSQVSRRNRDSGKSIILTDESSLDGFERAMRRGSIFAVADFGQTKDQYDGVDSATVIDGVIQVWTAGTVRWVVDGNRLIEATNRLTVSALSPIARFVRFEVSSADGSIVYGQPYQLRPRGDVDGDFLITADDDRLCERVTRGTEGRAVYVDACAARTRTRVN